MKLRPISKSLNKRSSDSTISIALRYINMKMCRVILANIFNVPKIRNIIEMRKFCRIFEAACEISDAPGVIKSNEEAVSMFCNISSERHFTKRLLFFLAAKITSSAGFKKNAVYLPKMGGEIGGFVCSPYFDHFASWTTSMGGRIRRDVPVSADRGLSVDSENQHETAVCFL